MVSIIFIQKSITTNKQNGTNNPKKRIGTKIVPTVSIRFICLIN